MADSDLFSSILPCSLMLPHSVETLDESSSSIASIGAHVVQSLALSSPNRDLDDHHLSLSTEASISLRNSNDPPSTALSETLSTSSLVSLEHGECNDTQVMPESQIQTVNLSESNNPDIQPCDLPDAIWDGCLSNLPENHQSWTPIVSPGFDTEDDSSMEWNQPLLRFKQEPLSILEPTGVGAGLWNLGNSCFVNSVLQCFTHTVPLIEILCSYKCHDPCNCGNEGFCVIRALRSHIKAALTTSECSISPYYFLSNLSYFSPDFQRFQQEDAHEFLQAFLDKLERCCLDRRSERGYTSSQDVNIVEHVFGGRLVSRLRCCNCNSVSETLEKSVGLSLEIEDVDNLWSALDSFTCVEKLEEKLTCENCKEKVSKEKQLLLDNLPQVATFHLKRFKNNEFFMEKIFKHVRFPLELDLQPYLSNSQSNEVATKYHLYAIVEHLGSLAYGHYCSYVRSAPNTWHKFDDIEVTTIDEDSVLSRDSYMLFYARDGTSWLSRFFENMWPLLEASLLNSSPKSVLTPTNRECLSDISYESVDKFSKPCDSAGGPNLHVKIEENYISLPNESNEDVFVSSTESSGEDSPTAELLDPLVPDDGSYNPCTEKKPDSCLAIEGATTGDDFVSLFVAQIQDTSPTQQGTFQIQLDDPLETTKNQEEEEPCKQPFLISGVTDSKETEIGDRDLMKKPSPPDRELDQVISNNGSPPKKLKTA